MSKIKVTIVKNYGPQVKVDVYVYPYSEYEGVCNFIKKVMQGGNFKYIELERLDK